MSGSPVMRATIGYSYLPTAVGCAVTQKYLPYSIIAIHLHHKDVATAGFLPDLSLKTWFCSHTFNIKFSRYRRELCSLGDLSPLYIGSGKGKNTRLYKKDLNNF